MDDGGWVAELTARTALTLTFLRNARIADVLSAWSATPTGRELVLWDDVLAEGSSLRYGHTDGWVYAVEAGVYTLGRLAQATGDDTDGFQLCYTATISTFHYASEGSEFTTFDLDLPDQRDGPDPNRFDREMRQAGWDGRNDPVRSMDLRFVTLAFGLELTPELITASLPTATLPGRDPAMDDGPGLRYEERPAEALSFEGRPRQATTSPASNQARVDELRRKMGLG